MVVTQWDGGGLGFWSVLRAAERTGANSNRPDGTYAGVFEPLHSCCDDEKGELLSAGSLTVTIEVPPP